MYSGYKFFPKNLKKKELQENGKIKKLENNEKYHEQIKRKKRENKGEV